MGCAGPMARRRRCPSAQSDWTLKAGAESMRAGASAGAKGPRIPPSCYPRCAIFSMLCTRQKRFHCALTLTWPLSVKRRMPLRWRTFGNNGSTGRRFRIRSVGRSAWRGQGGGRRPGDTSGAECPGGLIARRPRKLACATRSLESRSLKTIRPRADRTTPNHLSSPPHSAHAMRARTAAAKRAARSAGGWTSAPTSPAGTGAPGAVPPTAGSTPPTAARCPQRW